MLNALDIQVTGVVQGVGFRPFVYRLAKRHLVKGWVLNAVDGVHIHAEGEEKLVDEFVLEIAQNAPAAARVEQIEMKEVPIEGCEDFEIRFSDEAQAEDVTLVSPDLACCQDCTRELFDPANRRYRYPFINCTNCGPRFTIIEALPYDRAKTSMRDFEMCLQCAAEYADASDRRFHAQPDACFGCGPALCFVDLQDDAQAREAAANGPAPDSYARNRAESDAVIARAVEMLVSGKIVAVKGLGGFHLVCDAANENALANLRQRKHREGQAFAVMVPDAQAARAYVLLSSDEEALLTSPARPIVLLKKRLGVALAPGLADGLPELGIMLPSTPLQHLLLHDFEQACGRNMLVFTSGNMHDEPIQTDDCQACSALAGIADALLGNNRPICSRYDDSVARVLDFGQGSSAVQLIRRARGYAPMPLTCSVQALEADDDAGSNPLPAGILFATGPEQKNTFCLVEGRRAFVSQHIGDMENASTFDAWLEAKATYEKVFDLVPSRLACDMHPEYLASKWADQQDAPVVRVQHHHAHIVSVMAEHGLEGPVLGFAFDGTGFGPDGAIWGGEALIANSSAFERLANFAYVPLPGGAAAIKHPLRCAFGVLWAFDLLDHPAAADVLDALGGEASVCERMIETGLNTPYTSSLGRLFDAASAILGICVEPTYEGEPAILLESALWEGEDGFADLTAGQDHQGHARVDGALAYHIDIVKNTATEQSTALDTSVVLLDAAPAFGALLDDKASGVPLPTIARRFHDAVVDSMVQIAQLGQMAFEVNTVALSGGVFMNRYLCEQAVRALVQAGFVVAMNKELPPNDACVSFGQAVVASRL